MKKYFTSLLILLFIQSNFASTFYEQLCEFNPNWKKYPKLAPEGKARTFQSDAALVQAHLSCVVPILRNNPTHHLNKEQYQSRMHLIELLDGYRKDGKFPMNYYREERIPVFIDEHNTHCAVGYLLQQTGHGDVAKRIAAADNYVWVKDLKDPDVLAWQKTSGLSLEELKLIQGVYDYYEPFAFTAPNKHEIPQKPEPLLVYFENKRDKRGLPKTPENVWLHGEGKDGVLHGKWIQNYAVGVPWIEGYYSNGKRTGQWKEYYQGTNKLCRTENWRNDKLNGVRKRFDRKGKLIEEIMFRNGNAIAKTNYDLNEELRWVRKPLGDQLMWTEVYTFGGRLIASGHEKVHNPGNLEWFQNIELTALNSAAITAKNAAVSYQAGNNSYNRLYNSPPLVEYKKEGDWVYYREHWVNLAAKQSASTVRNQLIKQYAHFGAALHQSIYMFKDLKINSGYDSIKVEYKDNMVQHFYGHGHKDFTHLQIQYHERSLAASIPQLVYNISSRGRFTTKHSQALTPLRVKRIGQYNAANEKTGVWKHFDKTGKHYKSETYLVPWKEEELGMESSADKKLTLK